MKDCKLKKLKVEKIIRRFIKQIPFNLSMLLLIFSALTSVFILIPKLFNHIPVFSYWVEQLELPFSYSFTGNIKIVNVENEIITKDAEIYIGGYNSKTDENGDFELIFASSDSQVYYAVIRYEVHNSVFEYIVQLTNSSKDEFKFNEEIRIIHE